MWSPLAAQGSEGGGTGGLGFTVIGVRTSVLCALTRATLDALLALPNIAPLVRA